MKFFQELGEKLMEQKISRLRYLPLFEEDMNEIMYYITYKLRNPQAANHLVNLVEYM